MCAPSLLISIIVFYLAVYLFIGMYFDLTFGPFEPYIWYFKCVHHLLNFLSTFEAFCHQIREGHLFFFSLRPDPPSHPWFGIHVPPPPWVPVDHRLIHCTQVPDLLRWITHGKLSIWISVRKLGQLTAN